MKNMISIHRVNSTGHMDMIGRDIIPAADGYPGYKVNTVTVPMKPGQTERYRNLIDSRGGADVVFDDDVELKPFFLDDRKIVDKYHEDMDDPLKVAPKIRKLAENVFHDLAKPFNKNRPHRTGGRIVVFAKFMESVRDVTHAIKTLHDQGGTGNDLTIETYTGSTNVKERKRIKNAFNSGKASKSDVMEQFSIMEPLEIAIHPNILVVDDVSINRKLLLKILSSIGLTAKTCENGLQATQWCETEKFSIVLMDMVMPVMDGTEACVHIKAITMNRDTPVVFVSANAQSSAVQKCEQAGGEDFITKPIRKINIIEMLVQYLSPEEKEFVRRYVTTVV